LAEQPRQRDAARSRAAILDAAEALFAEHGFEAVTLAQIGAAAGVSRGTPGYFFGTKEALYRLVVERAATTLRMLAETLRVRDAAGARSGSAVVAQTVDALLGLLTSRRSLVRLLDREAGLEGEPHAEAMRTAFAGIGAQSDRVALTALAMCWFPLSHPGAARALGVDPDSPEFVEVWRTQVLAAIAVDAASATPIAAPPPADAPAPAEWPEPVKKKKKKKKKKKRDQ
jgi:TetR/AcrR family transcriptional regulator